VDIYKNELKQIFKKAKENIFEKVYITKDGVRKGYTFILNFFDGPCDFEHEPAEDEKFNYICKICVVEGFKKKPISSAIGNE
jgi:hypothetical protein